MVQLWALTVRGVSWILYKQVKKQCLSLCTSLLPLSHCSYYISLTCKVKYIQPPPLSNLNPEDSNLVNRTLTDYHDASGHHAEGIINAHTIALLMNSRFRINLKWVTKLNVWLPFLWRDWWAFIRNRQWVSGKERPCRLESEHLHVHIMMMNGATS